MPCTMHNDSDNYYYKWLLILIYICIWQWQWQWFCVPSCRDALDKLQVEPILYTREDYKTAGHLFTQRGFTPQHREQTTSLLQVAGSPAGLCCAVLCCARWELQRSCRLARRGTKKVDVCCVWCSVIRNEQLGTVRCYTILLTENDLFICGKTSTPLRVVWLLCWCTQVGLARTVYIHRIYGECHTKKTELTP